MSSRPPAAPLRTARLQLEPLEVAHAAEMVGVLSHPALYEHTGGAPPTEDELRERYRRQARGASPDGREWWLNWILRRDPQAAPVGVVQATVRDGVPQPTAELAWIVGRTHQGTGLATEAARAVVDWLRAHGVRSFEAHIRPGHPASEAVALRLGMEPGGEGRDGEVRWVTPGRIPGPVPRT
jgi:RimJ/RimL family protein N-acetyltransferase